MPLPTFSATGLTTWAPARGPVAPDTITYTPRQSVQASDSNRWYVYTYGPEQVTYQLQFEALAAADFVALLTFLRGVSWSEVVFTYTDSDAVGHTVRYAPGSLAVLRMAANTYSVTFNLTEQAV